MTRKTFFIFLLNIAAFTVSGQQLIWENRKFELKNVTASAVMLNGEKVLKVERDLKKLPFDASNMSATVDQPTYVKWWFFLMFYLT